MRNYFSALPAFFSHSRKQVTVSFVSFIAFVAFSRYTQSEPKECDHGNDDE